MGIFSIDLTKPVTVSVNGTALDEPYVTRPSYGQCNLEFPYYVPPENFFTMGDSRSIGMDNPAAATLPPMDKLKEAAKHTDIDLKCRVVIEEHDDTWSQTDID